MQISFMLIFMTGIGKRYGIIYRRGQDMNERIRELAEQAELNLELQSIKVEKFAQLIVRECASIASNPAPGCYSSFGKIILEHFGVEE